MKELDIFFAETSQVIGNTHFLNDSKPSLPFNLIITKRISRGVIEALKLIYKTRVKYRLLDNQCEDIQKNREMEEAEIERITQTLSAKTKIIMGIILRKNLISFISEEALYELKYISPISENIIDKGLELLKNRLLEFDEANRIVYAQHFCRDLDSLLYSTFDNIYSLEDIGWEKYYFMNSIKNYVTSAFEVFANSNIDLLPIIKQGSDFENVFGNYNDFRAKRYLSKPIMDKILPPEKLIKNSNEQEDITLYLNLDDEKKEEWINQGKLCDTVKELAVFIAQSYADGILHKVPSNNGGGLWNLSRKAFNIENTNTNRRTIENEFRKAYNPPPKFTKFN